MISVTLPEMLNVVGGGGVTLLPAPVLYQFIASACPLEGNLLSLSAILAQVHYFPVAS